MSNVKYVRKVAIVGGSGLMGAMILRELLATERFNVVAITRKDSNSTFPTSDKLTVKRGDYNATGFLSNALKGCDALIIILAVFAPPDIQHKLIKAAADAGVPYVLPCEFGNDNGNPRLSTQVPLMAAKAAYRQSVERAGKSKWIGVINNPWFEFSLAGAYFGIDVAQRHAVIYDDGNLPFRTTTMPTVALAVARFLSLPLEPPPGEDSASTPCIAAYGNNFLYISSFYVSQNELLTSVKRATRTKAADWTIEHKPTQTLIKDGKDKLRNHDPLGMVKLLYGYTFTQGMGDSYQGADAIANDVLALPQENLDDAVRKICARIESGRSSR